jgi:hypothetical protein
MDGGYPESVILLFLQVFLKFVYFWPGTQSLGLTTEDLFWTGNIKDLA